MASVSSFENLSYPAKSELRQFAELFEPLFRASSEEAKRQAVAALSQCPHVPEALALFIGSQPITIAAPFLACSKALTDQALITIARTQGPAHAAAITRRENLSPMVVDALVGVRRELSRPAATPAPPQPAPPAAPQLSDEHASARAREETLRQQLRDLARRADPPASDRLGLRSLTETQEALLVRFARSRDADHFTTALADALSASHWLAGRIMLDISGQQLATTLISLGLNDEDSAFVLTQFYPHLSEPTGRRTRAQILLSTLDPSECDARVEAWRRADSYTFRQKDTARNAGGGQDGPPVVRNLRPANLLRTGRG